VILYLDTSSLAKLYVEEPGSSTVRKLVDEAELIATSVLAYEGSLSEARSAFARRRREGSLTPSQYRRVKTAFDADWPRLLSLEVGEASSRRASELAEKHRLRGMDALHLAAYLTIVEEFPSETVRFSSADRALERPAGRPRRGSRPRRS
jgi:predicted nucleic acid-binding protein